MKVYNTLSQKIEELVPISDKQIGLYSCGPTVYDVAHIGNLRAYVFVDTLKRVLKFAGLAVDHVMNITDVDDKTIRASGGEKTEFEKLTRKFEDKFFADLASLNIQKADEITRATQYIEKMVAFVEDLMQLGYAYKAADGSIYFSIEKFKDYGKLAHLDKDGIKVGARVAQDEYDKENPSDFALWKAWDEKDGEIFWETSLGKGRPGWHIECSTMSMDKLGETFDIHTGGVDNIFPHHENEIAQSEAKTGKEFVHYWMHNEHLLVDGKKMSKSLGNFYNLGDIVAKGYSPLDFRYFLLGAHYRSKINFTWDAMEAAKNARERLARIFTGAQRGEINKDYIDKFTSFVSNDLDTSDGLAVLWEMVRDEKIDLNDKYATALEMDKVLGLELDKKTEMKIPEDIIELAKERKAARENKNFEKSDELRDKILSSGWIIEDLADNEYVIRKK